jgi:CubicO group peptidase (beta-lactamase class C family)
MKLGAQQFRLHDARTHKLGFLVPILGAFTITVAICNGATPTEEPAQTIWPTKEWQVSSPEKEGMDSKKLAQLVDWGTAHRFDSLLVVRHGKIVLDAYYAPYIAGIPHDLYSVTKSVTGTLAAIAWKEGLLDSTSHRVLDFFDHSKIANIDPRKEAITVQNLLDMTSGLAWTEEVGNSIPPIETDKQMSRSQDWVKFILDRPMSNAPGDSFNYDSGNPHLLSAILTKLTGMSAVDYAKAKLFGPLGIDDVSWAYDLQGISTGGFGLRLKPRDMAKIGYLYLRNGRWEGKQLLPDAWIDKVSHATIDMHLSPGLRYSNLFWALPEKHIYMARGWHGQMIMIFPDLDIVAVTTGHNGYPSSEFADAVSGSVKSDTTIPADAAGEKLLADKILDVSTDTAH